MSTIKQKNVFKKIAENHGNISKSMLQVGYSPNTAKKPQNLTESKGWQELMQEYLPDSLLAERHRELLDKREIHFIKGEDGKGESELLDTPDTNAVTKGLDMAYKIGGRYAPEKHLNVNIEVEASAEIKDLTQKLNELYGKQTKA